jgi:hypothetical protein
MRTAREKVVKNKPWKVSEELKMSGGKEIINQKEISG